MKTKINKKAAYEINNYTKEKLEIRQMLAELNTRPRHDISRGTWVEVLLPFPD